METGETLNILERYKQQILIDKIGIEGQRKIQAASLIIIGMGATGSALSNMLVRAGFGKITLVDRDIVELSNLQRQSLYDEDDLKNLIPKAIASRNKLMKINSAVHIDAKVIDVTCENIEALISGYDLVIDGTDNFYTRFLINDACVKMKIPWIFNGILGLIGQSLLIIPDKTPCLKCILPSYDFLNETCNTEGVLISTVNFLSSISFIKILKYFLNLPDYSLSFFDTWTYQIKKTIPEKNKSCITCNNKNFMFLNKEYNLEPVFCENKNIYRINPNLGINIKLNDIIKTIPKSFNVKHNDYVMKICDSKNRNVTIFNDARAYFEGFKDALEVKKFYKQILGV